MIKKAAGLGRAIARNPKKIIRLAAKQPVILVTAGPTEYGQYLSRAFAKHLFSHKFPNGITTQLDPKKAQNWHLLKKRPVVVVLYGSASKLRIDEIGVWMRAVQKTHVSFMVSPTVKRQLKTLIAETKLGVTEVEYLDKRETLSFSQLRQDMIRTYYSNDFFLLDVTNELPDAQVIVRLQHAAYTYHDEIGMVYPSYYDDSLNKQVSGVTFNYQTQLFELNTLSQKDYGQLDIPRYSMAGHAHGLYIKAKTLSYVQPTDAELQHADFDNQIALFIAKAWQQNVRTLTYSPIRMQVASLAPIKVSDFHKKWLLARNIRDDQGRIRVIYTLNATSISGGIRTVFEHINSLKQRGFAVELWSLQGQPTWTDLDVAVKQFNNYPDLEIALRAEEAIKVATWWETGQPVWIASVNNGVPIFMAQEFETWFYPNDPVGCAAVVSSYRTDFHTVTIAQYTQGELSDIGVQATHIPVGFEKKYYHELKDLERSDNTVLAVGRSFFQKNFAMTLGAWRQMGEDRPKMELFGAEPTIVSDERVTYHERPSNNEVNKLYNRATMFIQTSRHEGFCLPVVEAMAAGCPVISTDSHGNRDFCIDEQTCLIVKQDDVDGLEAAIRRLLGDKKLQAKLRKNGLAMAKKYEWKTIIDQVEAFYADLAD